MKRPCLYVLFFLLNVGVMSCSMKKVNYESLKLEIYSPYSHCVYVFSFSEDSVYCQSKALEFDASKNIPDTLKRQVGNRLADSTKVFLTAFLDTTKFGQGIHPMASTDAYQYGVYIKNKLVERGHCCNDNVHKILAKCMPYIDTKQIIICSSFFEMEHMILDKRQ